MKTTEEIKQASEELKEKIKSLIDEFVKENGECSVNITTSGNFHSGVSGIKFYSGHEVDINIVI